MTPAPTTPARPRAVSYSRISLDRKEEAGVTRQRDDCRKLAELRDFDLVDELIENSKSAYSGVDRPEYDRLLKMITAGDVDVVIVFHTDRLVRRAADMLAYMELTERRGVKTIAVTGAGIDPTTSDGHLLATVLAAVNEAESRHRAERVSAAARHARLRGEPKRDGWRFFGLQRDGLTHEPREATFLQRAARELLDGRSLRSIAADARAAGLTTTAGNPMTPATLRETLRNPTVAGIASTIPKDDRGIRLTKNRVELGPAQWEPIIDESTYRVLVALLSNPARATNRRGSTPVHLLSGIATCTCGAPMFAFQRKYRGNARRLTYMCKKALPGPHVSIAGDDLESYVAESVIDRMEQGDMSVALARAAGTASGDDTGERVDDLARQRGELVARRADFEAQAVAGGLDAASFARVLAQLTEQVDKVDAELTEAAGRADVPADLPAPADVRKWWTFRADLDDKRRVIRLLVDVAVGPGTVGAKSFEPGRVSLNWRV